MTYFRRSCLQRAIPSCVRMQSTHAWKPALRPGTLPVYDEALKFIEQDAASLREQIAQAKQAGSASSEEAQRRIFALEVAAGINEPSVRAQFRRGDYDLSKPVFRHLREQSWRRNGALARLEERILNMHILPDVVPSITPTVDLEILFGTGDGIGDHGGQAGSVLPGVFLDPAMTMQAPSIRATAFHEDTRKYTLMLVDPDMPSEETQSFKTFVHWLVSDVPLSIHASNIPKDHPELLPYIPPHPSRGTPYHRYTTLLFEQGPMTQLVEVPRELENVASFADSHDLHLTGIHFWRAKWSESCQDTISHIYKNVLNTPEPHYGRPARQDRLRDEVGERLSKYY